MLLDAQFISLKKFLFALKGPYFKVIIFVICNCRIIVLLLYSYIGHLN